MALMRRVSPPLDPSLFSTPTSSTAVKRKADRDDDIRNEPHPPHSTKGSSKAARLTIPQALEGLGEKMAGSIDNVSSVIQDSLLRFFEPIPSHKQRAILQMQDNDDLDDDEVLTMVNLFQADVTIADSYLAIK